MQLPISKILVRVGVVAHTCNPTTWEGKAGGSQLCSQLELHSEFEASPAFIMRPSQNQKRQKRNMVRKATLFQSLRICKGK
jgi:hypothetical protein